MPVMVAVARAVVGNVVRAEVADAQYLVSKAITVLPTVGPHAPLAQSVMPYPKLTLRQRHAGSSDPQPRVEYCASRLLKHVC